jgi:hypothetical protein
MILQDVIDRYCQVWSETDATRREELLVPLWADGASYTDPAVHVVGATALLNHIGKVQAGRPGAGVVRVTQMDEHHRIARFGFQVIGKDGTVLREGVDVVFMSTDGTKIERIIGFAGSLTSHDA